jgi:hypothetical protein
LPQLSGEEIEMNYMNMNPNSLNMGGTTEQFRQPTIADPTVGNPLTRFTPLPEAQQGMSDEAKAAAMVQALQAGGAPTGASPAAGGNRMGNVVSAGYLGQGMDTNAIGGAIGGMFK